MVLFDKIHRIIYNFPGVWLKYDVKPVRWILIKFFSVSSIFFWLPQTYLPNVRVHAYFAPVTPPPSVGGSRQRYCRCCVIL